MNLALASFIFKILVVMGILFTASSYVIFRIYGNKKITNLVVSAIVFFPFTMIIVWRLVERNKVIEIIYGNYLFFYTCFIVAIGGISLIHLVLKLWKNDLLNLLSNNKNRLNIVLFIYFLLMGVMGKINFNSVNIKIENITLEKKLEKNNIKIGFISDVHLSPSFNGEKLEKTLSIMEKQGVETIIIGGDFLENKHTHVKDNIKSRLDKFNFKNGIFLILGNHEYYGGIDSNMKYITELGIKILKDDIAEIDGIKIIGRDDSNRRNNGNGKLSIADLYKKGNIIKTNNVIVVEHNPKKIMESIDAGADMYLAGHTHNGQFFPFNLIVQSMYEKAYGLEKIKNTKVYVSSGLGTWLVPYRIGSKSEAIIFEISN